MRRERETTPDLYMKNRAGFVHEGKKNRTGFVHEKGTRNRAGFVHEPVRGNDKPYRICI